MSSLKVVFALLLVAFANANPRPEQFEETDQTDAGLFRQFIECARKALVTGIPEIELPSYDPLIITHELKQDLYAPGYLTGYASLENVVIKDIPNWEVRQFDELSADENGIDIFKYSIYWRDIIFTADWKYAIRLYGRDYEDEGTIGLELDHLNFYGIFNFTKSGPSRSETINDIDLHVSTGEAHFTGFGIIDALLEQLDEELVSEINTGDYTDISESIKTKLITDWILKPERIDAIVANCQK